jgi:hypothetical protein
MKKGNIKEITITMQEGRSTRIKSTKEGIISGEHAKEIKKILGLGNYQQIILDTRSEGSFSFKKTYKNI